MTQGSLPRPKAAVDLECLACKVSYGTDLVLRCSTCREPTEAHRDLAAVRIGHSSLHPLDRYRDLLPVVDPDSVVKESTGSTPLVHARRLGELLRLKSLYLKYEGANPTRSTKDRIGSLGLAFLRERQVSDAVFASTGNSSTAYAFAAQFYPELTLHIFCGANFLSRLNFPETGNVRVYCVDGSFVEAAKASRAFASAQGFVAEGGFFNPARRDGLKLAYLEAFDELPDDPAVVVQAISSGMGVYGASTGVREYLSLGRLRQAPRFVCAQQATCAPMYLGWRRQKSQLDDDDVIREPKGLAEAILRSDARETYPYMKRIVDESGGCFEAVEPWEIRRARRLVAQLEGLEICNASAVALGSAIKLAWSGWIAPHETVLVNLTGADRPRGSLPKHLKFEPGVRGCNP